MADGSNPVLIRPFLLRTALALSCLPAISASGPSEAVFQVVDARGLPLQGAVVEVEKSGGSAAPAFPWRMAMAQKNQAFVPGTLIVPVGATVAFPNLDTVRHSIYSFSKPARFKIDLYGRDQTRSQQFAIAGTVALGCNIHDTMRGYIRVVSSAYARQSDTNGYARIPGLGAGNYKVKVWHPRLRGAEGEQVLTATVHASGAARLVVQVK